MNVPEARGMVRAIVDHPTNAVARLEALRMVVAERMDATESARETASLARVLLDVEAALRSLAGDAAPSSSPVDELLSKRAARGAK